MQHIPDPLLAVKGFGLLPDGFDFGSQIENDHTVIRHCAEQAFDLRGFPKVFVAVKQPTLHYPGCFGICGFHSFKNLFAQLTQIFRIV